MSLKNVDIGPALRRLADRRIEEAMREGKFDNLPGAGKPLELEPMPAEENARMTWWALRIMKKNDFVPDEIALRKSIDHLREKLDHATSESELLQLIDRINTLAKKVNTLGTNAINVPISGVDREAALQSWRSRPIPSETR